MNIASLFAGMGGFDFPGDMMGWTTRLQCEIDPFAGQILRYY
jgi:site-specific DNA-cytosine methylase